MEQERLLIYHNGAPTSTGKRNDVHIEMAQHASIQFCFVTDDGWIVGQQRHRTKINGLCLDITGAGHMSVPKQYWSAKSFAKERRFDYNENTAQLIDSYRLAYLDSQEFKLLSVSKEAKEETNVELEKPDLRFAGIATYRQVIQPENNKGIIYANNELANVYLYGVQYEQLQNMYMSDEEANAIFVCKADEFFEAAKKDHEQMTAAFDKGQDYTTLFVPRFPVYEVIRGGLQRS